MEDVGGRHQNIRIIESADVEFDDWPLVAAVALPGERRPALAAERAVNSRRRLIDLSLVTTEWTRLRSRLSSRDTLSMSRV